MPTIIHYGTKGMKWGVRKARSGAKTFLTGDPSTSVLHPKGRAAAIAAGKKAIGKISNNKVFKATIFNKDMTLLTAKGRKGVKALLKKQVKPFEKKQLKEQQSDIAKAKKQGKTKEAAKLQKEIDDVYGKDLSPWED